MLHEVDPRARDNRVRHRRPRAGQRLLSIDSCTAVLLQIRNRLQAIALRKPPVHSFETGGRKLVVITNPAGDIVATAFEQDLRTADEDERARMLMPKPEHTAHELIVPASFRQLPWSELHARLRQHPALSGIRLDGQHDKVNGTKSLARLQPAELPLAGEAHEEAVLEPIDIRRPIVVVPGLLGSDLWSRTRSGRQGSQLWPPYTAQRGTLSLAKISKLDAAVPKLALAGTIFQAVYAELLAALRQMGYEDEPPPGRPKTLWVFPYDWTQSCDDAGRELAAFIAGTVLSSGGPAFDGVDVVNHSMGGVVTRAARERHGAPIMRSAYIASPHNGALDAYLALHPAIGLPFFDRGLDLILATLLNTTSPLVLLQRQVATWKSAYDMLPDDRYGPDQSNPYGRFPASMQTEILRARAFKASLPPRPLERHIIFTCNTNKPRSRWGWRHLLPNLSFLGAKSRAEDTLPYADIPLAADGAVMQPIPVDGSHAWLPSMPVVHAALRRFLAHP